MPEDLTPVPLRSVVLAVSNEIRVLGLRATEIEHALADTPGLIAAFAQETRASIQSLDHLVQSLDGIASFLSNIAANIESEQMADPAEAASRMSLRDLAKALSCDDIRREQRSSTDGDVLFF